MPKPVDDLVKTLLDDPDFYPKKGKDERIYCLGNCLFTI